MQAFLFCSPGFNYPGERLPGQSTAHREAGIHPNPAAAVDPALPVHQRRPLEGEAPQALRGWAYIDSLRISPSGRSASYSSNGWWIQGLVGSISTK
jgi:hypothetical protein